MFAYNRARSEAEDPIASHHQRFDIVLWIVSYNTHGAAWRSNEPAGNRPGPETQNEVARTENDRRSIEPAGTENDGHELARTENRKKDPHDV